MIIYSIVIFLCFLFYFINFVYTHKRNKYKLQEAKTNQKRGKICFIVISLFLIAIIGLRDISVGIDTLNYFNTYNQFKEIDWNVLFSGEYVEPGYVFLEILFNKIDLNFQIFLILTAIFYIGTISLLIYKYSSSPWFSYFLFVSFGYFTFAMSTIRQTIALSFVIISLMCLLKEKNFLFLILVILASTIHNTAIIFIIVYITRYLTLNKKNVIIFILISILIFIFKNQIQVIMMTMANNTYERVETGGNLMYLFCIGTIIIDFIFGKGLHTQTHISNTFIILMLIGVLIFPITQFHPAVMRLQFYFLVFMIIYIPNMLKNIYDKAIRNIITNMYILISLVFFITRVLYESSGLIPYIFFWE